MFDHIVNITNLHLNTSDHSKTLPSFLQSMYCLLEQWRAGTSLSEQQNIIDAYNTQPKSPYVSLWLFEHENQYGWRNTFPTSTFHACLHWPQMILKERLPLLVQRMEQAVAENDDDLFKYWESKSAARMFRRLLVGENMEAYHDRVQHILMHVRKINQPLFEKILSNLPQEYIAEHQTILHAQEFLANRKLLEFFNNNSRGLNLIDTWLHYLDYAVHNVRTLSPEVCESIYNCWKGRESRNLSDKSNSKIVAILAQNYPAQFDKMFPLFFDLDDTDTAPQWQIEAAVKHFPEYLPNVAGVLADQFFNTIMREGSAPQQWREMHDFYNTPGVLECVVPQKLPLDMYYIICNAPNWQSNIQKALDQSWDFAHPGLQEMANLLLDFAGGEPACAPQYLEISNSTSRSSQHLQDFERLLQKRTLEREIQPLEQKIVKVKKM